jgi:hypothetical protein
MVHRRFGCGETATETHFQKFVDSEVSRFSYDSLSLQTLRYLGAQSPRHVLRTHQRRFSSKCSGSLFPRLRNPLNCSILGLSTSHKYP